jgi:hypothetical protein
MGGIPKAQTIRASVRGLFQDVAGGLHAEFAGLFQKRSRALLVLRHAVALMV